jgi:hypothetical protein
MHHWAHAGTMARLRAPHHARPLLLPQEINDGVMVVGDYRAFDKSNPDLPKSIQVKVWRT